jgi:hypothetical protein
MLHGVEMGDIPVSYAVSGLFFTLIFIIGFWLSRSGKPYNGILFNAHKLTVLATVVYLTVTIYKVHQAQPLGSVQITASAVTAACFLVTILTGGLGSLEKAMPAILLKIHRLVPYLTLLSSAASLYLVFGGK